MNSPGLTGSVQKRNQSPCQHPPQPLYTWVRHCCPPFDFGTARASRLICLVVDCPPAAFSGWIGTACPTCSRLLLGRKPMRTNLMARLALALTFLLLSAAFAGTTLQIEQGSATSSPSRRPSRSTRPRPSPSAGKPTRPAPRAEPGWSARQQSQPDRGSGRDGAAPAVGHIAFFTIPATGTGSFLAATPPNAPGVKYLVTVTPHDASNHALGAAATPVSVTQAKSGPQSPVDFGAGAVFPDVELVGYVEHARPDRHGDRARGEQRRGRHRPDEPRHLGRQPPDARHRRRQEGQVPRAGREHHPQLHDERDPARADLADAGGRAERHLERGISVPLRGRPARGPRLGRSGGAGPGERPQGGLPLPGLPRLQVMAAEPSDLRRQRL